MPSTNISMLQTVANGLGDLKDEMVFARTGATVGKSYFNIIIDENNRKLL